MQNTENTDNTENIDNTQNTDNTRKQTAKILIFGGTIEGRQVSEYLCERHIMHTVCVATEYGEEVLLPEQSGKPILYSCRTVHQGRMNKTQMCNFLREEMYALVIDATHPYAVEVSENIQKACEKEQIPYVRYLRPDGCDAENTAQRIYVGSAREAAEYLEAQQGGIFLTTGSKELHVFTECISDKSRLFARVLPSAEVIASCRALGLEGKQICAMQGPFSAEINAAMLKQTKSAFLVTKESGASGGFPEKMEAVRECQITAVIIRRPKEDGADWEKVRATIDRVLDDCAPLSQMTDESPDGGESVNIQRRISCIGIGMGTPETLTREAAKEICEAQVIFGAKRILDSARALLRESADGRSPLSTVMEYNAQKIYDWLEAHPQVRRAAILMSGDVGFYSGARQVAEVFPAGEVRYYCGISSIAYFASKIPTSWQDAKLLSAHGKELALLNYVKKYPKIILLVGGAKDVERLCRELCDGGMDQVRVTTGSNLSYPEEMVRRGSPADFLDLSAVSSKDKAAADLYIMMVENPDAGEIITPGIPDEKFVRGKVPMTKEEIRALSVAKLRLKEDSVIYDIGAGTGSVSAECARLCTAGKVYAIERNPEGIALIRENGKKIGVSNLVPIEGTAPDAMRNLPAPTHAFIGGTSGSMREIIETLLEKNPSIRIVINTVTLESIAEVTELVRKMGLEDADIVQISAAKSRTLGGYHMMTAHNPVYIVSFGG